MAKILSKSKLISFRQCPKKLWLSLYQPQLLETSADDTQRFEVGYAIGDIAQTLYNFNGSAVIIDAQKDGFKVALSQSKKVLQEDNPVFEAGLSASGLIAFADVMLPKSTNGDISWHMVEVKSSTTLKDYYVEDAAIQTYIAHQAGVNVHKVSIAHVNNQWVYPGDQDYAGILVEEDITKYCEDLQSEVNSWVTEAKSVSAQTSVPDIEVGSQCFQPFECGFYAHCTKGHPIPEHSVNWLPGRWRNDLADFVDEQAVIEMADVPDHLLNETQLLVKQVTLSQESYFDRASIQSALAQHSLPAYFLDFETAMFAVPLWKGWKPYQQIPFQFSLHVLDQHLNLSHQEFLDLSGEDPSLAFANSLIKLCRKLGPIYVYNAGFESSRIRELAARYADLSPALLAINERLVDLHPIAKAHFYAPSQQGSWSIKKLLPAISPELDYSSLEGVKDGGMAMEAYKEAIHSQTTPTRKDEIYQELLAYCKLDTYAMVSIWTKFTGHNINE